MKWWFGVPLWARILGALALGVLAGYAIRSGYVHWGAQSGMSAPEAEAAATKWVRTWVSPFGDLFMRLLRMVVVPLILCTIVAGMVALGDPKRLGTVGTVTIGIYLAMTMVAVMIGLIFGSLFQPGRGLELSLEGIAPIETAKVTLTEQLLAVVPQNPVGALVEGNVLAIIFFAILFGIGIILSGPSARPVGDVFTAAAEAMLKVTQIVMEFAPVGVFALITFTVARQGIEAFANVLILIACVYTALAAYVIVTYFGILKLWLKLPLGRFFLGTADAAAVGYSTASSNATLPVTIACTTRKLGVNPSIAGSTLPLGATINMDGTALYLGVLSCFTAQVFGFELTLAHYVIIVVTATLSAIGAAGIPSASLFLAAAVLTTFGASAEQIAVVVAFILPVDRIMDMARTSVNVISDSVVAVAVAKVSRELDEEVYRGLKVYEPSEQEQDDLIPPRI